MMSYYLWAELWVSISESIAWEPGRSVIDSHPWNIDTSSMVNALEVIGVEVMCKTDEEESYV